MATKPVYAKTPSGGIQFISQRKSGEVRIPNYVYDIWMPLLGVQVVGVYAVYCRLEREHAVKGMNQNRLAKMLRIGTHALRKANALLEKCGFVTIRQPQGHERQMHFTTEITVLDPPDEVSSALIAELSAGDYEPLSAWLVAEPNFNPATPELQSSNAGTSIQQRDESGSGNAKIASLNLQPFGVASLGGLQPPPGARAREEPAGGGVEIVPLPSLQNFLQERSAAPGWTRETPTPSSAPPPSPPEWALMLARHAAHTGRLRNGDEVAYAWGAVARQARDAPVKAGVLAMPLDEFVVER